MKGKLLGQCKNSKKGERLEKYDIVLSSSSKLATTRTRSKAKALIYTLTPFEKHPLKW